MTSASSPVPVVVLLRPEGSTATKLDRVELRVEVIETATRLRAVLDALIARGRSAGADHGRAETHSRRWPPSSASGVRCGREPGGCGDFRLCHRGAGSAGCVLANRLTEDRTLRVLLWEAGGEDAPRSSPRLIAVPAAFPTLLKFELDWAYTTVAGLRTGKQRTRPGASTLIDISSAGAIRLTARACTCPNCPPATTSWPTTSGTGMYHPMGKLRDGRRQSGCCGPTTAGARHWRTTRGGRLRHADDHPPGSRWTAVAPWGLARGAIAVSGGSLLGVVLVFVRNGPRHVAGSQGAPGRS